MNKIVLYFMLLLAFNSSFAQSNDPCFANVLCESKDTDNTYPEGGKNRTVKFNCGSGTSTSTMTRVVFYKLLIRKAGKFAFKIKPKIASDYDWVLWKNISNCNSIDTEAAVRASFNAGIASKTQGKTTNWDTGMDLSKPSSLVCDSFGAISDGMVSAIDVVEGDEILIAIDMYGSKKSDYTLAFEGVDAVNQTNSFVCVEETNDTYYLCDELNDGVEKNYNLNAVEDYLIKNHLNNDTTKTLSFYIKDLDAVKDTNPITTIDIANKGKVFCRVSESKEDKKYKVIAVDIELVKYPTVKNIEVKSCAFDDLSRFNNLLISTSEDTVEYYLTIENAKNRENPLAMPVKVKNNQVFYAVVKNKRGCTSIGTIKTTLEVPKISGVTICYGDNATLSVVGGKGKAKWYKKNTDETPIYEGESYITENLTSIQKYYVEQDDNGCVSDRVPVTVIVKSQVEIPEIKNTIICYGKTASLEVKESEGNIYWYTEAIGGVFFHEGFSYITENLTSTQVYYLERKKDGCISDRIPVTVTVKPNVNVPLVTNQTICYNDKATLTLSDIKGVAHWYNTPTSDESFYEGINYTTENLVSSQTYYVEHEYNGCISERVPVTVNVKPQVEFPVVPGKVICYGENVELSVKRSKGKIYWYKEQTGGVPFHEGDNYTTDILTSSQKYYVEQEYDGCISDRITATVTVKPKVEPPLVTNQTICYNQSATLSLTGVKGKALWYKTSKGGDSFYEGTNYITGNLTASQIYYVEHEYDECISERVPVIVTVKPKVESPVVTNQTICYNEKVTLKLTGVQGKAKWYKEAVGGLSFHEGENYTTGTLGISQTYYVEQEFDGCISLRVPVTVTVKPKVESPNISGKTICYGETAELSVSGSKGKIYWYNEATGGVPFHEGDNYTTDILTTSQNYYVEQEYDGCISDRTIVTVTVKPKVEPPLVTNQTICYNQSTTLSLTGVSGKSLWYKTSKGGASFHEGTNYITGNLISSEIYYVEQEYDGCISERVPVIVTVKPKVESPVVTNQTICYNEKVILKLTGVQGKAKWYKEAAGGLSFHEGENYTTGNLAVSQTYYVEQEFDGCISLRVPVTVTVKPKVESPNILGKTICYGETAELSVSGSKGKIYWFNEATGGVPFQEGITYTTGNLITSQTYYVEQLFDGCISERIPVTVTVKPKVESPVVTNQTICYNEKITLTLTGIKGKALWYKTLKGGASFHEGANYTTGNLVSNQTYYVEQEYDGCISERVPVTVTVKPKVEFPVVANQTICYNEKVILKLTGVQGKAKWYKEAAGGLSFHEGVNYTTGNLAVSQTYYVEQEFDGCISLRVPVTVTVKPKVESPNISGKTICYGETAELSVSGSKGKNHWYKEASGGTPFHEGNTYTTGNLITSQTYYVEQLFDGCISERIPVTVTVKPKVESPVVTNQTICYNEKITLTLTGIKGKALWYKTSKGGASFHEGANYTTGNLVSNQTYYVEQEYDGCISERVPVTVTVKPKVEFPVVANQTICYNEKVILKLTGVQGKAKWYKEAAGGLSFHEGVNYTTGNLAVSQTYYVEQEFDGCISLRVPVTVTVKPKVESPNILGKTICYGETAELSVSGSKGKNHWYKEASGGTPFHEGNTYTTGNLIASQTYYVEQLFNGCISERVSVTITVKPKVESPVVTNQIICYNQLATLSLKGVKGKASWYKTSKGGASFHEGNNFTTGNLVSSETYYVEQEYDGCISERVPVTVTVKPKVESPVVTNQTICYNEKVTLKLTGVQGKAKWYKEVAGGLSFHEGENYITGNLAVSQTYYVEQEFDGCISLRVPVTVTVKPKVESPNILGKTICYGETAELSVSGSKGEIHWYREATGGVMFHKGDSYKTGNLIISQTYYVEQLFDGCIGDRIPVTVTVKPKVESPLVINQTICYNHSVTLSLTGVKGKVLWYKTSKGGVSFHEGVNYTTGNLLSSETYYVEQEYDGCISERVPVTVTVKPNIETPVVTNQTICYNEKVTLKLTGVQGKAIWYKDAVGGLSFHEGVNYTTGNLIVSQTYYVEQEYNGCISERVPVTVTVKPKVEVPVIANQIICFGEATTFSVIGSKGKIYWYRNSADVIPFHEGISYDTGNLISSQTFYVEQEYDDCISERISVTVTVKPKVPSPVGINQVICYDKSSIVILTGVKGKVSWYKSLTDKFPFHEGNSYITGKLTSSQIYYIEQEYDGCSSDRVSVTVTVKPDVDLPEVKDQTICYNESSSIKVEGAKGKIYWYKEVVGGLPIYNGIVYNTGKLTETQVYYVEQEFDGCISKRVPVKVTVKPKVASPEVTNEIICFDHKTILKIAGVKGKIYWFKTAKGGSYFHEGDTYNTDKLIASQIYYVEQEYDGCISDRVPVTVTVKPKVVSPVVTHQTICYDQIVTLKISKPKGKIYWYSEQAGGISFHEGENYTTKNLKASETYYVEQEIDGCISDRVPVKVTVKPKVVSPLVVNETICYGTTAVLKITGSNGIIYWYKESEGGTAIYKGDTYTTEKLIKTQTYYVEQEFDGCISDRVPVTVTVKPQVPSPEVTNEIICYDHKATLTITGVKGRIYWFRSVKGGTAIYEGDSYTTDNLTTSQTYYVEQEFDNCISERVPVTVTVKPKVSSPVVTHETICYDHKVTLKITGVKGKVYWYKDVESKNSFHEGDRYTTEKLLTSQIYYVEQLYDGCISDRVPVKVTVKPKVEAPIVTNDTICYDKTAVLRLSGVKGKVSWYKTLTDELTIYKGDAYVTERLTTSQTYYVEQEFDGCISERVPVTVIVKPKVPSPIISGLTVCYGETALLSVNGVIGEIYWYKTPQGGVSFHQGNNYTTENLFIEQTYYLEQVYDDCISERIPVTVKVNFVEAPKVENVIICANESAVLEVKNPKGSVIWYDNPNLLNPKGFGAIFNTNNLVNNTKDVLEYKYYVLNEFEGCTSEVREVIITVISEPARPKLKGATICSGDWAELYVLEALGDVTWYDSKVGGNKLGEGNTFSTQVLINETNILKVYTFYAEQRFCNNISERAVVNVVVLPQPKIGKIIKGANSIEIIPTYGKVSDYVYSIDDGKTWEIFNKYNNLDQDKVYHVRIKNQDKDCYSLRMEVSLPNIKNVITPNGDGANDYWEVKNLGELERVSLKILDRLGKVVYETTDPSKLKWDGKYLGRPLPTTSYWYILIWKTKEGKEEKVAGWILLKNN